MEQKSRRVGGDPLGLDLLLGRLDFGVAQAMPPHFVRPVQGFDSGHYGFTPQVYKIRKVWRMKEYATAFFSENTKIPWAVFRRVVSWCTLKHSGLQAACVRHVAGVPKSRKKMQVHISKSSKSASHPDNLSRSEESLVGESHPLHITIPNQAIVDCLRMTNRVRMLFFLNETNPARNEARKRFKHAFLRKMHTSRANAIKRENITLCGWI